MLHRNKIIFYLSVLLNFKNYDSHLILKKLVDKKNDKVKFDNITKTNEEYISVTYGWKSLIDSYRF